MTKEIQIPEEPKADVVQFERLWERYAELRMSRLDGPMCVSGPGISGPVLEVRCMNCDYRWTLEEKERHRPGCAARPFRQLK